LKSPSAQNLNSLSNVQLQIKGNLKERPQTYQEKHIVKPLKRPVSGFTKKNFIIPEEIRNNPFADLPILSEKDMKKGFFSLMNQGFIPKNADLTQGLARPPIYRLKSARIHSKIAKKELISKKNSGGNNFFLTEKIIERRKQEKFGAVVSRKQENCLNYREIVMIQTFWRKFSVKRWFKRIILLIRKIQKLARRNANLNSLKGLLRKRQTEVIEKYEEIQKKFKDSWKNEKHIEIIVNSSNEKVFLKKY